MDGENVGTTPESSPEESQPAADQPKVEKVEVPVTAADSTAQQSVTPEPAPMVATPEQPAAATETITTAPPKAGNWKLIVCIVLLAALVGLVVYYWSTGAFK